MITASRLTAVLALLLLAAAIFGASTASASGPPYGEITELSAETSDSQAGGHPTVRTSVTMFNRSANILELPCSCDDPRVLTLHYPTGFIGNPHAIPLCTMSEFALANCPMDSQVGIIEPSFGSANIKIPLYNMETRPSQAGQVAFVFPLTGFPVFIDLQARTDSDYGLDAVSFPIVHILVFPTLTTILWGVPANPEHDFYRFKTPLNGFGECGFLAKCGGGVVTGFPAGTSEAPYVQSPTTCGVPLEFSADVTYYNGVHDHKSVPWPETTGCDTLAFNPSLTAQPTTPQADSASGVDVDLKVPQGLNPKTPSSSEIRTTTIAFPPGFSINPNAADGKVACPDANTAIGTLGPATCPEFAKIGTVELDSSALPDTLPGALYITEPLPGNRFRILLTGDGFGTHIKLPGELSTDPSTGQVVTSFENLPQSPLQEFRMHIFGSERGLLATPTHCGEYPVVSEFVPWDSALPRQSSTSFFTISSGPNGKPCPGPQRPFNPTLDAGTANPTGGTYSPFTLRVLREDGDQNITNVSVTTPPGFLAKLKGVSYCPQSAIDQITAAGYTGAQEQASPACPSSSQVGTVTAGAGAGSHPVYARGKAYLAGPYKGAPLSLLFVVPAVSGPYDLGVVAVRAALNVDPITAQVSAASDSIPQILEGVPLRLRSLLVELNRSNFTLNPTNCDPFSVSSTILGDEGGVAHPSTHFQAANCNELAYSPNLSLKLTGGIKRLGHPAVHATFTQNANEANNGVVQVTLPPNEILDNAHLGNICTRPDFAADKCPASSMLGTAEVNSPLLEAPLKGNVYLEANPAHELPDLSIDLEGQIEIQLSARIDSSKAGGLRATFETVPDAPISSVAVDLLGGSKGLLRNSKSLCGKANKKVKTHLVGQNGAVVNETTKLQVACGGSARHKRHHGKAGH